jgi:hypothetical protein
MKRTLLQLIVIVFLGALPALGQTNSWQNLFGDDFSQLTYPEGSWEIKDGVLTGLEDQVLWALGEHENFQLNLEFKNESGTNSGVIVYCTDNDNWIPNSVEIQIADDHNEKWGDARKDFQCGAIFGHLPASEQKVVKKPGQWNTMEITCKGRHITVVLNGKKVTFMDMALWTSGTTNPDGSEIPSWLPTPFAELPTKGTIGFQGKHGDASIHFRNVKIKSLK